MRLMFSLIRPLFPGQGGKNFISPADADEVRGPELGEAAGRFVCKSPGGGGLTS